jgi:hypothetical protein
MRCCLFNYISCTASILLSPYKLINIYIFVGFGAFVETILCKTITIYLHCFCYSI